ncbi:MAG: serine/threonine protein phosphatase [Alphaproteobacteria bacterium]|nr:serine/threonine protein phosphatase [Alphaproteobacteria bacterium]
MASERASDNAKRQGRGWPHWPFRRTPAEPEASLPAGRRLYAVGDIHGRLDLLEDMLALIAADRALHPSGDCGMVFLGDYVDRGSDSRGVVERLRGLAGETPAPIFLMGNHEAMLLHFLEQGQGGFNWLYNGGAATLLSYGVAWPATADGESGMAPVRSALAAALPTAHREFLSALRLWHGEGDYLFVHAGVRPGVPLAEQSAEDLLWIREEFLDHDGPLPQVVVHGHTIARKVELRRHRIGIDTGAYHSGRLTCLVLEGSGRRLLAT